MTSIFAISNMLTKLLHPAFVCILGSLVLPFLKGRLRSIYMLALLCLSAVILLGMGQDTYIRVWFMDQSLLLARVDGLSLPFAYMVAVVSFIAVLFSIGVDDTWQHVAAFLYVGSALGIVLSGDLLTLYVFWELLAVSSTFFMLARRTKSARQAAYRYALIHMFSGLCLLSGILAYARSAGSLEFERILMASPGGLLIFGAVAISAAIMPLHCWLVDACSEATPTGSVFMSAITTKVAVYVMARAFAGFEILVWAGAAMAVVSVLYGLIEDNIRRVLGYGLITQVGMMLICIGLGSPAAINGAVLHAFSSSIYIALLFMATGAVLHMTGKDSCSDFGGLYRRMPLTALFCVVGGASIAGVPFTSGFVSQTSMVRAALDESLLLGLAMNMAVVGAFLVPGFKVTWLTFFGSESGIVAREPRWNMLLAMGIASALTIVLGLFHGRVHDFLPYHIDVDVYTASRVVEQLELILFAGLAFCMAVVFGFSPAEKGLVLFEMDWIYRKFASLVCRFAERVLNSIAYRADQFIFHWLAGKLGSLVSKGPEILALGGLVSVWRMLGFDSKEVEARADKLRFAILTDSVPVGIAAAFAALFLVVLFFAG